MNILEDRELLKTAPLVLFIFLLYFNGSSALADLPDELHDCAIISNTKSRLSCYDVLSAKYDSRRGSNLRPATSKWKVTTAVSPISDMQDVFLQLRSEKPVQTDVFGEAHPILVIQCVNRKTNVAVNWEFIVGGGTIPLTYRIDEEKPETVEIKVSDDFRSVVSWNNKETIEFLKTLSQKDRLAVQITAMSQGAMTAVFDVKGLDTVITPLRKSCGW